jgi:hypothetical protein
VTFTELVNDVAEKVNVTSATAIARIGRSINTRYKDVATSIGLQTTARGAATAATIIGNRALTFGPTPVKVQKVYAVYDPASPVPPLRLISFEEMRQRKAGSGKAKAYAVQLMGADSVTILLDNTPLVVFTWYADAEVNLATLSGTQVPSFSESYHDILTYAAIAVELEKMEKYDMAKIMEKKSEDRLSQLRLFIAEEGYAEMYQGKTERGRAW